MLFFYPLFSVKMSSRSAKAVAAVLIQLAAIGLALTSILSFPFTSGLFKVLVANKQKTIAAMLR